MPAALLRPHPGPGPSFSPIAARSAFPPAAGDVYVEYQQGSSASAELSGEVKRVTKGEVAQLYARQFPYTRAPVPVGTVILHPAGSTATYAFRVTPILATRYTVEVFGSTAAAPLATSAGRTIYDAYNWNWTSCNQDTEAQDGMGLPGRHGCGDPSVDVSASYLG